MDLSKSLATVGQRVLGRYQVTGRIGSGSMASVYLARDLQENHLVALKLLHPSLAENATAVRRFKREAKTAMDLRHKGAVRVFDWGFDDGVPFIVMELIEGETLYDYLLRRRRLSQLSAIRIGIQLCDVLDAAHNMGFVHRDLKPENIMVLASNDGTDDLKIKVLDFGVVKYLPRGRSVGKSDYDVSPDPESGPASTTTVGTPTHMAPEQARGQSIDTRVDIYTCGILLFEMATGALPFDAADPVEVTRMHVRESPPSPRNFVPQIHPEFEAIILRCLEKKPIKRWQTARELGRQLTRLSFIVEELGDLTELSDTPSAPVAASQNPQRSTMPTMPAVADFDSVPPPDSWRPEDSRSSLPVVSPSSLPPVGPRVVTPIGGIPEVESAPHDTNDAPASPSLPVASPSLPPQQEVAPEAETPVQSEAISAVTETSDSAPVSRFGLVLVAALGALLVIAMWWMLS